LRSDLDFIGFIVNPYDACVANCSIKGTQHTVVWHVDDLKSSHKLASINNISHEWLNKVYDSKNIGTVKAVHEKVHKYLGMTLDYSENKVLHVHMKNDIELMLKEFPYKLDNKNEKYAWDENLFKCLNNHNEKLEKEKIEIFQTFIAKRFLLAKRGRPDILPCIAYFSTKVRSPSANNWDKITILLRFSRNTKEDILRLSMEDSFIVKWYLDASFAVHEGMKIHTGAVMLLVKGVVQAITTKQRTNTRSSKEAELILFDGIVSKVLWTRLFLNKQGYTVSEKIIY
jgi:hypothetical protein